MKKIFYLAFLSIIFSTNAQNPGEIDTTFNLDANAFGGFAIAPLPNGQILASGGFIPNDGQSQYGIIKLNADGSIDDSFNTEGIGTSTVSWINDVFSIVVQEDEKIIIGGAFSHYNGVPYTNKIVRVNSDGSLDNSFNIGQSFSGYYEIYSVVQQADGKVLATGNFKIHINGDYDNYYYGIFRSNTDGSIDNTFFDTSAFSGGGGRSIIIQEDGKILVGGLFTSYNGQPHNRLIRLNIDGSVDTTFNTGTGFNNGVYSIALQEDGKIIVAGNFTTYNEQTYNRIIRLNTDGSIDSTFNIGTGFDLVIDFSSITIQSNGKILVGGWFTEYNGQPHNRIIRLNTDGSVDTTFNTGTGFNETVTAIAIQEDGKILVGGWFNSYNGQPTGSMVRLYGDGSLDVANFDTQHNIAMYPNPANDMVIIDNIPENATIKVFDSIGKLVYNLQANQQITIDTAELSNGIYLVQIIADNQRIITKKLVVNKH